LERVQEPCAVATDSLALRKAGILERGLERPGVHFVSRAVVDRWVRHHARKDGILERGLQPPVAAYRVIVEVLPTSEGTESSRGDWRPYVLPDPNRPQYASTVRKDGILERGLEYLQCAASSLLARVPVRTQRILERGLEPTWISPPRASARVRKDGILERGLEPDAAHLVLLDALPVHVRRERILERGLELVVVGPRVKVAVLRLVRRDGILERGLEPLVLPHDGGGTANVRKDGILERGLELPQCVHGVTEGTSRQGRILERGLEPGAVAPGVLLDIQVEPEGKESSKGDWNR
jgi:hypothetical protein